MLMLTALERLEKAGARIALIEHLALYDLNNGYTSISVITADKPNQRAKRVRAVEKTIEAQMRLTRHSLKVESEPNEYPSYQIFKKDKPIAKKVKLTRESADKLEALVEGFEVYQAVLEEARRANENQTISK